MARAPSEGAIDPRSLPILIAAAVVLAIASALMFAEIEPMATWYYSFAWYPTIAIADAWAHRRRPSLAMFVTQPRTLASLVFWSAVVWLFFELWNLRLANWYYVGVPDSLVARRLGVFVSFGTVLPGMFALEKLLRAHGVGESWRTRGLPIPPWLPTALVTVGVVWAVLVLGWPQLFYPLVWGVTVLLLVPVNERLSGCGLLSDLGRGDWGRIGRLLLAGLLAGLLWEMFNIRAASKWIYTVPGFEEVKLFEMPVLGFLGFPPFALECFVMYRTAVLLGVAVPWEPEPARRRAGPLTVATALWFAGTILVVTPPLVDHYTIDSFTAPFSALPAIDGELEGRLEERGIDSWGELAEILERPEAAAVLAVSDARLEILREQVTLARLRGIGAVNVERLAAVGVGSRAALAAEDPAALTRALAALEPERRVVPARQRLWVRAARRALGEPTAR